MRIYLSRNVSLGIGIELPAAIEEIREAYALLNGTDTIPLETATAYVCSDIPHMHDYLYEVPVTMHALDELNYLAHRIDWMDAQESFVFGAAIKLTEPKSLQELINLACNLDKFDYWPGITTEAQLGEALAAKEHDMISKGQVGCSDLELLGKSYRKACQGVFMECGFVKTEKPMECAYDGISIPDLEYKIAPVFMVWLCKKGGNHYDNYKLALPASEAKMDLFKSGMGITSWSDCEVLVTSYSVADMQDKLPKTIEKLNDLALTIQKDMEQQEGEGVMQIKGFE